MVNTLANTPRPQESQSGSTTPVKRVVKSPAERAAELQAELFATQLKAKRQLVKLNEEFDMVNARYTKDGIRLQSLEAKIEELHKYISSFEEA